MATSALLPFTIVVARLCPEQSAVALHYSQGSTEGFVFKGTHSVGFLKHENP